MHTWATIRTRWTSFLGTFAALAFGVAIVTASLLVHASAAPAVPERYAATGVIVHGVDAERPGNDVGVVIPIPWSPQRTAELQKSLAAIPGVKQVVADLAFYAQAVVDGEPAGDVRDEPQGHGWSSTLLGGYTLDDGRAPAAPGEIVVPAGLGVRTGTDLTVLQASGPVTYKVVGVLDGPGYYLTDAEAAKLADGVGVFGLLTEDPSSVDAAATAIVTDGAALSGDERAGFEPESHLRTRWLGTQLLTAMTLLSAFSAVFVVASTFAFGVAQRRRELGLLRTVGATPGQVRRMLFGEALGVGAISAGAGVVLGLALAPVLGDLLVKAQLEPPDFAIRVVAWPLLVAGLTGMAVAFLGVWSASRRAARVRPMEALREAAAENRPMTKGRWILGGLALAGGLGFVLLATGAESEDLLTFTMFGAMGLIVGLTLWAPLVIPPVVRLVTWPFARTRGATAVVVRESALIAVRRVASTAAPVLVTVGFVALLAGMMSTMKGAMTTDLAQEFPASVVVEPDGTPGLTDAAVSALPGEVQPIMMVDVYSGTMEENVTGLPGLAPGTLFIAAPYMETLGLKDGDTLPLVFPDGETLALPVKASQPDDKTMYPSTVTMARETLREHAPNALTEHVYLNATTVAEASAATGPGAIALDREGAAAFADQREWELLRVFMLVLIIMSIGYTALAIANTLIMANADRLRDFAVLRLSGAADGQVLKVVAIETVIVVTVGTALGLGVALAALEGVRRGLESTVDAAVSMAVPWDYVGLVIGSALVLALGASLVTARAALRRSAMSMAGVKE
ncbi:ABC transporter permease [Actinorhabdospora filicis]|uniref:ABC transporter permease n=1 Tax=Actinorhabdospora filicis TaxID=1785913 RepID=A0A9W6W340_9ACTN|nr:FtsX-like permease family protein [Actinorhabdospora filicis]GLZ77707.1 ABC transporter permease [Actinorhabdospora filicis]